MKLALVDDFRTFASLVYHDIFDYPLTPWELKRWRVGKQARLRPAKRGFGGQARSKIENKQGYFFLKGRSGIVKTRRERQKFSVSKIEIAESASRLILKVPTVKFIGLTGAVAMLNAESGSDIDFLMIVEKGTLWTTRLIILLLLDLFGIPRRRFGDPYQKDRLCLNIWLDESDLSWSNDQRNIYTAHEICQIVPLYNKAKTWEKFIWENRWIKKYWPDATRVTKLSSYQVIKKSSNPLNLVTQLFINLITFLTEPLTRTTQLCYMRPKITREVVKSDRAIFHPHPLSQEIVEKFERKLCT